MKTMKIFPLVLIVISFFTASCVDNVVSPQVEAIRTQQVEWMKAKTATELALAAMQNAQVAYQQAQTAILIKDSAYVDAVNAINLKNAALDNLQKQLAYDNAKAANDVALANYQTQLTQAKIDLANALANLATITANANTADATTDYNNYVAQANIVSQLTSQKLTNAKQIADDNIALTFGVNNLAIYTQQIGYNKTTAQNQLAAETAALAVYNATATDPASVQTQIDNLTKLNAKYQSSIDSANLVITNKTNDKNTKYANYNAAETTITNYTTYTVTWISQQADSISKEAAIVTTNKSIATLTNQLTTNNAIVATNLAIYTDSKTNSDAKQATYNSLFPVSDADYSAVQKANNALSIATANLAADPANTDLLNAKKAAQTAQTTAQATYTADLAKTNKALAALVGIGGSLSFPASGSVLDLTNQAKNNYDAAVLTVNATVAVNGYDGTKALLTKTQATLATQKQALADTKTNIAVTRNKIIALNADYQKSLTTVQSLYNTYQAVTDDINKTQAVIDSKNALIVSNNNVVSTLRIALNNANTIQQSIATTQAAIITTKNTIALDDQSLTKNQYTDSQATLTNDVAVLTQQNAAIDVEITNANKLATYWKSLLDKLFN